MIRAGIACCIGASLNDTESFSPFQFRFEEVRSPDFLDQLSVLDKAILANQTAADQRNDLYTPLEDYPEDRLEELTPFGILKLGEPLYKGYESVVYTVENRPDLIIKYQAMCHDLGKPMLHPLVTDFWYSKKANQLGIAPEPLFLSPPAQLCDVLSRERNKKFPFTIPEKNLNSCLEQGGIVRYMILRRSEGLNLHQFRRRHFPNGIVPMKTAASILILIIRALSVLHDSGKIVHGDIHLGNILMDPVAPGSSQYRVLLIDFGRAMMDDRSLTNDRVNKPGEWNHQLCSPWQVDGRAWSRRDDVYKAVHGFAALINPTQFYIREHWMLKRMRIRDQVQMKKERFMFFMAHPVVENEIRYDSDFDPILNTASGDFTRLIQIEDELRQIQSLVTFALDDINASISYDELVRRLERLATITTRSTQ